MDQDIFEFAVIFQVSILKIREIITISKIAKNLIDIAIINWILSRIVMATIFCGKGVKILQCLTDCYILDISNQGNITGFKSRINIQSADMLCYWID